jgi:hypothetical protein
MCCYRRTPQTTLRCDSAAQDHVKVKEAGFLVVVQFEKIGSDAVWKTAGKLNARKEA